MYLLNKTEGISLLLLFGVAMVGLVWLRTHTEKHADGFLVADRDVSLLPGAASIAVSWMWAPAIFICSLQSYTKGLPGIFWFTVPNVLCFFLFAPLALRLRTLMPQGYTLPEFIFRRFDGHRGAHVAFLVVYLAYQLGAIVINALAGGALLHALSGISFTTAVCGMSGIALAYSLLSGLKASIFTDSLQMGLVLFLALVIVPWCLASVPALETLNNGLGGFEGKYRNLFDPWIAFSMGIPMSIGLLSGPIGDQMFFQRAMAVRRRDVVRIFVCGGLIFACIPVLLSLLGFIGADLVARGQIEVSDPQLIGPIVVGHLLPKPALYAFCLMAFAGLCSTMDSGLCAGSSLGCIDIYKRYFNPGASNRELLRFSRIVMLLMTLVGTGIAFLQPKLLWCFLIYSALASAVLFPTIFAVFWDKVSARAVCIGVSLSLLFGTPLSIYANVHENPYLIVTASVLSVSISLLVCLISGLTNAKRSRQVKREETRDDTFDDAPERRLRVGE